MSKTPPNADGDKRKTIPLSFREDTDSPVVKPK